MPIPEVPPELAAAIEENRCAAYVGSGLSMGAGYPSWGGLLEKLIARGQELRLLSADRATELGKHVQNPVDYLMVAEELRDQMGEGPFRDEMARVFGEDHEPTDAYRALVHVRFAAILTTNYDRMIENAYASEKRKSLYPHSYEKPGDLLDRLWTNQFFLLKAHGTVDDRKSMVITKRDYRNLIYRSPGYRSALETIFNSRSILFLGAGLRDPELEMLLGFLHDAFQGMVDRHFALLPDNGLSETVIGRWMRDYSVRCLTYTPSDESHKEVAEFLRQLPQQQ